MRRRPGAPKALAGRVVRGMSWSPPRSSRVCAVPRLYRSSANVGCWHKDDLRLAAPEGPLTSGLPTLAAEGLFSGGKPTVFRRALKAGS